MPDGSERKARPRLGLVAYLNSRPIGFGLLSGRQRGLFEVVEDIPSALADSLARGELDLALIPSVEVALAATAGREAAIVPGIAIAARGAAESVLLFRRVPWVEIRSIAVDLSSRTSAALMKILLRRRLRPGAPDPEFVPSRPDLPRMLRRCDAALLIGDRALLAGRRLPAEIQGLEVNDLGAEWMAMTGLPFVFAVWAGPVRRDSPRIVAALQDSLEEGLTSIPRIARQWASGDPAVEEIIRRYLFGAMHYRLGHEELRGLETYYRLLAEEGFIPQPPALRFHPGPG